MLTMTDPIISLTAVYGRTYIRMRPFGCTWNVNRVQNRISSRWIYLSIFQHIIGFGILFHSRLHVRHNPFST